MPARVTWGFRSHAGKVYCAAPTCLMPAEERRLRIDLLDSSDGHLRCALCGLTLEESIQRAIRGEAGADRPVLADLSVRACSALRRYYERHNMTPQLNLRPHTDLAEVDARAIINFGEVGPKTLAELRNAAQAVGVDLQNAAEITRVPNATGPWQIRAVRVMGQNLQIDLQCAGATLKLLRPSTEAPTLLVGSWVSISLTVVPNPSTPTEATPSCPSPK